MIFINLFVVVIFVVIVFGIGGVNVVEMCEFFFVIVFLNEM